MSLEVVKGANKQINLMLESYENAHFEETDQSRSHRFYIECQDIERQLINVPHTQRTVEALRKAKYSCFWKDAITHLQRAERETAKVY